MESAPLVLFVSNELTLGVVNFIASLEKAKQPFKHLGLNCSWGGWRWRMKVYRDALQEQSPDRWVATSDGDDVLCVRALELKELQHRIEPGTILVSAEGMCGKNCSGMRKYWAHRDTPRKPKTFKYPNAGGIVGRAIDLANVYTWMLDQSGQSDDNLAVGIYCNHFPNKVHLDYEGEILSVVNPYYKKTFHGEGKIVCHRKRRSHPCLVHFPGSARDFILSSLFSGRFGMSKDQLGRDIMPETYIGHEYMVRKIPRIFFLVFWSMFSVILLFMIIILVLCFLIKKKK
jgi:hypothetical protein